MKYTRLEIHKRKKSGFKLFMLQFFIVIPVLAIVVGYLFSSLIIIPRVQKGTGMSSNTPALPAFKIIRVDALYFLQAGLYSNRDKAAVMMETINKKGFNASLGFTKGTYRIVLGISDNMEEIQKLKNELANAGYNGIINKIDMGILDKSSSEELKVIRDYLNISSNLIKYQQELLQKNSNSKVTVDEKFKNGAVELERNYSQLEGIVMQDSVKQAIGEFNKYFNENYTGFINNSEEGNKINSSENVSNEVVSLLELYRIIAQDYIN